MLGAPGLNAGDGKGWGVWGVCSPRGGGNTQGLPEQERVELGLGLLPGAGEEALHGRGERGATE